MAYGFFVPVFFIEVGMRLEVTLNLVLTNAGPILLIFSFMLLVKLLPSVLLVLRGFRFADVLAICCLLAAPLTLFIAIVELGVRVGEVEPEAEAIAITAAIAASLVYPSLARLLLRGREEAEEVPETTEPIIG
jgi:Kef-type K+ transport system membrane component KefB